ncbi:MAG: hypothetical protein IT308_00165 [Anaerolineaceae bacterium]|nr:hypothetical protein [Anaerolineaceae bacterium]
MTLDPPLRACWMRIGQQKQIPATRPGAERKQHIFEGTINTVMDSAEQTLTKQNQGKHLSRFQVSKDL